MAHAGDKFRITSLAINGSAFTALVPLDGAKTISINNPAGGSAITIATDPASTDAISLAAGAQIIIQLSPQCAPAGGNEILCWLKGSGTAPVIVCAR